MEVRMIEQIEKYEILYNYNLPEYSRKDLTEAAWVDIAANINMGQTVPLSVNDCRTKWRNIRTAYLKSLKSTNKARKPYHLARHLEFVRPYLKCKDSSLITNDTEMLHLSNREEVTHKESMEISSDDEIGEFVACQPIRDRKRRRSVSTNRKNVNSRNSNRSATDSVNISNDNKKSHSTRMFLRSLLPELENISEDQIRQFKIKTLLLIDDIKDNYTAARQGISTVNNVLLDERLMNLLLKHLYRAIKNGGNSKKC